jgi:hypothetical protein
MRSRCFARWARLIVESDHRACRTRCQRHSQAIRTRQDGNKGRGRRPYCLCVRATAAPWRSGLLCARGLLVTDALESVNRVVTFAIDYHELTAMHRHPDWIRLERGQYGHAAGPMSRTLQAFLAKQPDHEEPLRREQNQRHAAGLRDALRPVVFPQTVGNKGARGCQDAVQVGPEDLLTLPCSPTVH